MYKKKFFSKYTKKNIIAVWGNCKLGRILMIIDRRIKYRFRLVVKLIANKYYIDLFCYLSYLLFLILNRSVDFA